MTLCTAIQTESKPTTEYIAFKKLAGEVRRITQARRCLWQRWKSILAPFNWFDSGTRRRSDVVAVSTFGILTMAPTERRNLIQNCLAKGHSHISNAYS